MAFIIIASVFAFIGFHQFTFTANEGLLLALFVVYMAMKYDSA